MSARNSPRRATISRGAGESGFSLVEVLIAAMITSVISLSLLQGLKSAIDSQSSASRHWSGTIERWNKVQILRTIGELPGKESELVAVAPGGPTLLRFRIMAAEQEKTWEVLLVQR